jgi:hypothetical protein
MKTQNERVLKYLQTHKRGITQLQALDKLGVLRLSGRIHDLREMGYPIMTNIIEVPNRYGEISKVAEYRLMEK